MGWPVTCPMSCGAQLSPCLLSPMPWLVLGQCCQELSRISVGSRRHSACPSPVAFNDPEATRCRNKTQPGWSRVACEAKWMVAAVLSAAQQAQVGQFALISPSARTRLTPLTVPTGSATTSSPSPGMRL